MNTRRWEMAARLFMGVWVVFTLPSLVQVLHGAFGLQQLAIVAGFLLWGATWIWFWVRGLGRGATAHVVALVANVAVLSVFALIAPGPPIGVGGVLVFAFIVAGAAFPLRQAVWIIAGLAVLQVVLMIVRLEPPDVEAGSLVNSLLVGSVGVAGRMLWVSYNQLLEARHEIGRLAVSEERLRFARDLHDLLGQNLAMIVLKSELVARQLPPDADESLRQEMRDVARVGRKSLADVREAVAGYRKPTLAAEVSAARASLRAAAVTFALDDELGAVPDAIDAVLAWSLREAVTNVIKHSAARHCDVRLWRRDGAARLEVVDDGRGAPSLEGGFGLAGMKERVRLAGGSVEVHPERDGFRLQVSLPLEVSAGSELAAS